MNTAPYTGLDILCEDHEVIDTAPCEACDGDAAPLGQLGRLTHYRCSCCGWTFAQRAEA